jgi:inosine-uridine nucleoside N-ribohydrolase
MELDEPGRLSRLRPPSAGRVRAVLDTDTYNEIDDQFAIAYALLSPERLDVEAIYAAPFFREYLQRSASPGDGMEKSYEEILRVLDLLGISPEGRVHRGSTEFLADDSTPAPDSAAVDDLIARARSGTGPLYVMAIGAITNVASAILRAPDIVDKLVVVWLGSHAPWWPDTREFNHAQDIPGVRVLFGSGVPLVHVPCMGVASHLQTTVAEMEQHVKGQGAVGDYLCDLVQSYEYKRGAGWSKVIWDIAAVAWMIEPAWVPTQLVHAPIAQDDATWTYSQDRHFIRQAYWVNRDLVYHDFFKKLAAHGKSGTR